MDPDDIVIDPDDWGSKRINLQRVILGPGPPAVDHNLVVSGDPRPFADSVGGEQWVESLQVHTVDGHSSTRVPVRMPEQMTRAERRALDALQVQGMEDFGREVGRRQGEELYAAIMEMTDTDLSDGSDMIVLDSLPAESVAPIRKAQDFVRRAMPVIG
jgi:hypothetical protein